MDALLDGVAAAVQAAVVRPHKAVAVCASTSSAG